jgi:hypothetical protein
VEAALSARRRRRRVLAVWVLLGALVVAIAGLEFADRRRARPVSEAEERRLLPVAVEALGAVEIADHGRLHRFERDAAGGWFYHGVHGAADAAHTHAPDPALSARIDAALGAFGRTRVERRLAVDKDGGTAYGVTAPDVVVLVYRRQQSQPLAQYAVGGVAPDTVSRYVLRVGDPGVVTIPNYQIENLQALVRTAAQSAAPSTTERR